MSSAAYECPPDDMLSAFVEGSLAPADSAEIDAHLDGCAACMAVVGAVADNSHDPTLDPARPVERIDRYVVERVLGVGAMGRVYAAFDPRLGRRVALKVLRETRGVDGVEGTRLLREAQALARLSHPNVVEVFDVGRVGARVYIAMELVEGTTLREWTDAEPKPDAHAIVASFIAAGHGLVAAHERGIVHRDFKPDNVLVGRDGRVRVTDFGLASTDASPTPDMSSSGSGSGSDATLLSTRLTRAGTVMGTPAYMSPEQFAGREVTPKSDQFAFCVALYEALYGARPFQGRSFSALAEAVARGHVRIPRRHAGVSPSVRRVLIRGLAVAAEDRFASMSELVCALTESSGAGRASRRRWVLGTAVVGAGLLVGTVARGGDPCEPDAIASRYASVWNDARGRQLRGVFDDTSLRYAADSATRTIAVLDKYGGQWIDAYAHVCDAEAEPKQEVACLEALTAHVDVVAEVLIEGGPTAVERSVEIAASLPPPESCLTDTGRRGLALGDVDLSTTTLRTALERARALRESGRVLEARTLLFQHHDEFEALGDNPLRALELLERARIFQAIGELDHTRTSLERAYEVALAAGEMASATLAAFNLVAQLTIDPARASEVEIWLERTRHAAEQTDDVRHQAMYRSALAAVVVRREGPRAGREAYAVAADMLERDGRTDDTTYAAAMLRMAEMSTALGDDERAYAEYQRAREVMTRALGDAHPRLRRIERGLGNITRALGRPAEARQHFERALALEPSVDGSTSERHITIIGLADLEKDLGNFDAAEARLREGVALYEVRQPGWAPHRAALIRLGMLLADTQRFDEARSVMQQALDLLPADPMKDRHTRANIVHSLGEADSALGNVDLATREYTEAIELWGSLDGESSALRCYPLTGLGELLLAQGRRSEARAQLEHSLSVCGDDRSDRDELGETKLALARAIGEGVDVSAADRARAHALALEAAAAFDEVGARERARADEARAWAAAHPAS